MVNPLNYIYFYVVLFLPHLEHHLQEPKNKHIIYVSSISWHTGILVPAYSLPDSIWSEGHDYRDAPYLEIGWGDADFYPHDGFNLRIALKAAFWPTSSVLHVNPINRKIEEYYVDTNVVRMEINDEQLHNLCLFLVKEFALDENGKIIPAAPGIYSGSHFYKGSSSYYFPNNSNVWAARAIKKAGFSIRPIWYQTTGCVLNKMEDSGILVIGKD